MTTDRILELLDDPEGLEALYREAPDAFRRSLDDAARAHPDSMVLRVWQARLGYRLPDRAWRSKLTYAIGIALGCGALVRLPALWLGEEWYYPRLAPTWVLLALTAYFWIQHRDRGRLFAGLGLTLVAAVYVSLLPDLTDSVVMGLIHLPLVFWIFLGLVFTGDSWREVDSRIQFVHFNGELVVLTSVVALGGMVFSGVTVGLFSFVFPDADVEEWYFENVGLLGAVAVPVVGAYLYDAVFRRGPSIAAVLARVFAPLFLVMALTYLTIAFAAGQNPFFDRSFLITFNALMLVVLGITVFSIVERPDGSPVGLIDYINIALAGVTLLIDAIALSAILFRLASFGFTPNRVVVLGANAIIMVHLAWICWTYIAFARRQARLADMRRVIANYLPVYGAWAAVVAFLIPLLFGFS